MKRLLSNTMIRTMEAEAAATAYPDRPAFMISMFLALMVSFVLVLPSTTFAEASLGQYAKDTGMKLTTGVVNISTGWAERSSVLRASRWTLEGCSPDRVGGL